MYLEFLSGCHFLSILIRERASTVYALESEIYIKDLEQVRYRLDYQSTQNTQPVMHAHLK